jgi:hypothetical protein
VFKALVVNATTPGTTSSSSSLLLDLQVGTVSQFSVTKAGAVNATGAVSTPAQFIAGDAIFANGNGVRYVSTWIRSAGFDGGLLFRNNTQTQSVGVVVEADNTLALRNGANGQTFSVYGTYPGAAWERFTITAPTSGNVLLGTYRGTGGIARGLEIQVDGTSRWLFNTSGHLLNAADNTCDIGASGASRPRNVYVASQLAVGTFATFGSFIYAENYYFSTTKGLLAAPSDGVFTFSNRAATDFTRLQFGGTTNLFPAIKRSSTTLQARLADDSAFAPIQGKLTTDTAFDATVVTPTGFITLYDSTGTAYKVPCVPA